MIEPTMDEEKEATCRKRWIRKEEMVLVNFLRQHPDIEKPTARIYYNKFLFDTDVDANWKLVRSKVRNMRTAYRRAKEYEINKNYFSDFHCDAEAVRSILIIQNAGKVLKICWYVDDFDVIFPNEMDKKSEDASLDKFSNQKSFSNITIERNMINEQYPLEDKITSCSSSKSIYEHVLAVQKNIFNLKRQKHATFTSIKQQEHDLAREKLNFEKEKFRQEFILKEKALENHERLKVMQLQIKEKIAMKELELMEQLALKSTQKV